MKHKPEFNKVLDEKFVSKGGDSQPSVFDAPKILLQKWTF
jgi:hypothetical protein